MPLSNAQTRDVESVLHPYTNLVKHRETGPVIFERGKGVFVYDDKGKDYIEAMAGLWCTALGWGENELAEAAAEQMRKLAFGHLFAGRSHEPAIELAEKLKEVAPFPVSKVFFANSGSEANDTQIKMIWYATTRWAGRRRRKSSPAHKAYHGVTIASASLTGLPANHKSFDLPLNSCASPIARITTAMPSPARARRQFAAPHGRQSGDADRRGRPRHHRRDDRRAAAWAPAA